LPETSVEEAAARVVTPAQERGVNCGGNSGYARVPPWGEPREVAVRPVGGAPLPASISPESGEDAADVASWWSVV